MPSEKQTEKVGLFQLSWRPQGIAIVSSLFGWMLDSMDLVITLVVLAAVSSLFFVHLTGVALATAIASTYIIAIYARPIGSLIFGHYADKLGRKTLLLITVSGYGGLTIILGLIPTVVQIGITALVLLYVIRFIQGLFIGGEYAAGYPLAMEFLRPYQRGFWSGVLQSGYPFGYALASGITAAMLTAFPGPSFSVWGWRLAFIIAGLIPLVVFLPVRLRLVESELWAKTVKEKGVEKSPAKTLFTERRSLMAFLRVFLVSFGVFISYLMILGMLPGIYAMYKYPPSAVADEVLLVATLILGFLYWVSGHLSQLLGRRVWWWIISALGFIVWPLWYALVGALTAHNLPMVWLWTILLVWLGVWQWGPIPAYLSEMFRTRVRATGVGFGYSSGIIIAGFYAFYAEWLGSVIGYINAIALLGIIGYIAIIIGAYLSPETKDLDLEKTEYM